VNAIPFMRSIQFSSILVSLLGFLPSLDQLIRPGEHLWRNRQTDLLRGLEIYHQLKLRRFAVPARRGAALASLS
jgi:hypothetical protein